MSRIMKFFVAWATQKFGKKINFMQGQSYGGFFFFVGKIISKVIIYEGQILTFIMNDHNL